MDIRQLLQLKTNYQSNRSCDRILGIHRNTINYYVRQFKASGMSFQALMELSDYQLLELFSRRSHYDHDRYRQLSDQFILKRSYQRSLMV